MLYFTGGQFNRCYAEKSAAISTIKDPKFIGFTIFPNWRNPVPLFFEITPEAYFCTSLVHIYKLSH